MRNLEHSPLRYFLVRQYLFSKVCPNREFGFFSSLLVWFAKRAQLKISISLNPSPPTSLGRVSISQETQHIFWIYGLTSHQNRVSTDWICWHSDIGNLKQDIAYVGIVSITALRRIILPAPDKYLDVQLCACCFIMSTIRKNVSFFLPKCSGKPKYLPITPSLLIFSSSFHVVFCCLTCFKWECDGWFGSVNAFPWGRLVPFRIESRVAQLEALDFPKTWYHQLKGDDLSVDGFLQLLLLGVSLLSAPVDTIPREPSYIKWRGTEKADPIFEAL